MKRIAVKSIASKRNAYLISSLLTLVALVGAASFTPQKTYYSTSHDFWELAQKDSAVQVAENLLHKLVYLPAPAIQQSNCFNVELFQVVNLSSANVSTRKITGETFTAAQLSSTTSLLSSMLDDDPIIQAEIEMLVRTVDGQETPVTLILWEYGLLTPWATYLSGDGWKIDRLCLNEPSF